MFPNNLRSISIIMCQLGVVDREWALCMRHQISLPHTTMSHIDNMCTQGLTACWFHRPWVRLKLPRNQSRDQYFPRLRRVTRGAHTVGTSMLCLWGCGSRGCISLVPVSITLKFFISTSTNIKGFYSLLHRQHFNPSPVKMKVAHSSFMSSRHKAGI